MHWTFSFYILVSVIITETEISFYIKMSWPQNRNFKSIWLRNEEPVELFSRLNSTDTFRPKQNPSPLPSAHMPPPSTSSRLFSRQKDKTFKITRLVNYGAGEQPKLLSLTTVLHLLSSVRACCNNTRSNRLHSICWISFGRPTDVCHVFPTQPKTVMQLQCLAHRQML